MKLILDSCVVRSWEWNDRDSIVKHANNHNVWINLRDRFPYPYAKKDAKLWLEMVVGYRPETNFAIAVNDEAVGGIGFSIQPDVGRRSAEIGYWIGEEFWGRGITTDALRAVSDHVFAHFDVCRLFANVFEWNTASTRVLEKSGYVLEGRLRKSVTKDNKTVDQLIYAKVVELSTYRISVTKM